MEAGKQFHRFKIDFKGGQDGMPLLNIVIPIYPNLGYY